jgi:hypothetical protein
MTCQNISRKGNTELLFGANKIQRTAGTLLSIIKVVPPAMDANYSYPPMWITFSLRSVSLHED